MPDIAVHHAFGQEVKASLPPEIQRELLEEPYTFALYGPDPWFMYQPWKRRQGRGRRMHTTKTGSFLISLAGKAMNGSSPRETFSYLAGFLCHYALDSTTHPYIIWRTTETWPTRKAHMDLEHALDISLLKREGFWTERHPVTDHHFPRVRLPASMREDLNAVYQEVYGWSDALPALNACYARYRMAFRVMEAPCSVLTVLAALFPTHRLRAFSYRTSAFLDRDVENLSHQPWYEAYAPDLESFESFPELVEKAKSEAVRMIGDCYAYARAHTLSKEALARSLGNRSYLSGLDVDDSRNYAVSSLCPPKDD